MNKPIAESEIGAAMRTYFLDLGWEVFEEVKHRGYRADLVARSRGGITHVVECKTTLSWKLLEQAAYWHGRGVANMTSIAVPVGKRGQFIADTMRLHGIGMYECGRVEVRELVRPRLLRRVRSGFDLREEHKTYLGAGSAGGGYWTPFRGTCDALTRFVARNGGCTMREAVSGITHHYGSSATARSSLARWIREGAIKGVELRDGKLYTTGGAR